MEKKITGHVIYLNQCLGQGSYGTVYVGMNTKTKMKCAIKVINRSEIDDDEYAKKALVSQIAVMKSIQSPNVVQFIDTVQSNKNYYIVQELCQGDLEGLIKKKSRFSEDEAIHIIKDLFNGFLTLLKEGIIHRDLKLGNIMHLKGQYKIGDFGLAKKNVHQNIKNSSLVGTPLYMAPEILKSQRYTSKCDIWSLGIIFYELLHGHTPWDAETQCELLQKLLKKPVQFKVKCSKTTQDFILNCLKVEEQKRISWEKIYVHPLFGDHFKGIVKENELMEHKMKKVMTDLRYIINSQNIDISKLLKMIGLKETEELNEAQFQKLMRSLNPSISPDEQKYCFSKLDKNGNAKVSIAELTAEMQKNKIAMTSSNKGLPLSRGLKKQEQSFQNTVNCDKELEDKIRKCFEKLHKNLTKKNMTLYNIFQNFDLDKNGYLTVEELEGILHKLDKSFEKDQSKLVFKVIDLDNSNTIDFFELNSYYSKIIGIPETMFLPENLKEKMMNRYKKK